MEIGDVPVSMMDRMARSEELIREHNAAIKERQIKSTLDKDDFLKLFITQLVHQNPMEPLNNDQFIAQMSQFTAIEQATNTATGVSKLVTAQEENNELLSLLLYHQVASANKLMFDSAHLIGRMVICKRGDELPVQSTVVRVMMNDGEVMLELENGQTFYTHEVTQVS